MRKYMKERMGMPTSIVKTIGADGEPTLANFCKGKLEKYFLHF